MKKILIIEDETDVREVITDILDAEDFFTIAAENGAIGIQLAQEKAPDLIICDMMMPEMDGQGVLSHLRQDPATATTPFIFLTAKAEQADRREGMNAGADDYITKPFTRTELLSAVTARLEKQTAVERQVQTKLGDLRSSISLAMPHELNTPLNGIINSSQLLLEEMSMMEDAEILEVLELIRSSSLRLSRLVQNFMLYAQLEVIAADPSRTKALRSGSTYYAEGLITEVAIQKAKQHKRSDDLQLMLNNASVQISDAKLKKVIEELVDNAFKFSRSGDSVRIISASNDETFSVYIIDHGHGMTEAQIADLGAYMQFNRRLYEQQGTGLGFTIAQRLIELHDGDFSIESIPGSQTTVRVVLPLAVAASEL